MNPDLWSETIVPLHGFDKTADVIVSSWEEGTIDAVKVEPVVTIVLRSKRGPDQLVHNLGQRLARDSTYYPGQYFRIGRDIVEGFAVCEFVIVRDK